MKTIEINDMTIGMGTPKICVPVFGKNEVEILEAAGNVPSEADLVEFRLDYYEDCMNLELVETIIDMLKKQIDKPLIVTLRTKIEGGEVDITTSVYCDYISQLIKIGGFELIDIELKQGKAQLDMLVEIAHQQNIKVIMSNHDFAKTPQGEKMLYHLLEMEHAGADIAKLAVMPEKIEDVLTLLNITYQATKIMNIPLVTMSMGSMGMLSRVFGNLFGSVITFAMAGEASAPGQIDVRDLHKILQLLDKNA